MDHIVSGLAKLLLIYSTGQQNNSAVNLINRVLLSAFATHKHFFVQITLFSFLPLLVLFLGAILLVPFCHFLHISLYCNYASLLSKYPFLVLKYKGWDCMKKGRIIFTGLFQLLQRLNIMFLQLSIDFTSPYTCIYLVVTQTIRHPDYHSVGKETAVPIYYIKISTMST